MEQIYQKLFRKYDGAATTMATSNAQKFLTIEKVHVIISVDLKDARKLSKLSI